VKVVVENSKVRERGLKVLRQESDFLSAVKAVVENSKVKERGLKVLRQESNFLAAVKAVVENSKLRGQHLGLGRKHFLDLSLKRKILRKIFRVSRNFVSFSRNVFAKTLSDEKWYKISLENNIFYCLSTSKGASVEKSLWGGGN
jgi:hypothetical protein